MQNHRNRQRSSGAAVTALIMTGLATGCVNQATEPAAPVSQAADSPVAAKAPGSLTTGGPVARVLSKPHYIVVEHGQSLNGIAYSHHVTPAALAAANHLPPPYKLKIGSRLALPNSGPPPLQQANVSGASPPAPLQPPTPPASPEKNQTTAATAPQPVPPSAVPPDGPPKESAAAQPLQAQALAAPVLPRAPPVLPPRNPAAALPLPGEAL